MNWNKERSESLLIDRILFFLAQKSVLSPLIHSTVSDVVHLREYFGKQACFKDIDFIFRVQLSFTHTHTFYCSLLVILNLH